MLFLYPYCNNNPISFTDRLGLQCGSKLNSNAPILPDNADVIKNIHEAELHPADYAWFNNQVKNKGPWDYKQEWRIPMKADLYGPGGNFNFGATAAAASIPLEVAERAAGYAQQRAGTSTPKWGNWWGNKPYGDDPDDQYWIEQGYNYYGSPQYAQDAAKHEQNQLNNPPAQPKGNDCGCG